MSKIKMRCITCGKWFQSANAKDVTCPDCTQKARKEKLATKNPSPPTSNRPANQQPNIAPRPPAPPKPKPIQGGTSHWLDKLDDVKVGQPEQPPSRPKLPPTPPVQRDNRGGPGTYRSPLGTSPGTYRDDRSPGNYRDDRGGSRGPGSYRMGSGPGMSPTIGQRPRYPMEPGPGRGPRPDYPDRPDRPKDGRKPGPKGKDKTPRPPSPPKPKREKTPPPQPFVPTPEQVTQVEERYIILATPSEFDGIRTQISKEVGIPKKAVKKIIKDLRDRQHIPSWWELQTYKGTQEELDRIKAAYEPLLPIPPVGVHKQLAEQLDLKPGIIYQAIKAIRQEMNLPQYNDPALHVAELPQTTPATQPPAEAEQALPSSSEAPAGKELVSAAVEPSPAGETTAPTAVEPPPASVSAEHPVTTASIPDSTASSE